MKTKRSILNGLRHYNSQVDFNLRINNPWNFEIATNFVIKSFGWNLSHANEIKDLKAYIQNQIKVYINEGRVEENTLEVIENERRTTTKAL